VAAGLLDFSHHLHARVYSVPHFWNRQTNGMGRVVLKSLTLLIPGKKKNTFNFNSSECLKINFIFKKNMLSKISNDVSVFCLFVKCKITSGKCKITRLQKRTLGGNFFME
jgi:hypothetical protein